MVFDDGSGEVADIIAMRNIDDKELIIDLFHCKCCSKKGGIAKPGVRLNDVYQVQVRLKKVLSGFVT